MKHKAELFIISVKTVGICFPSQTCYAYKSAMALFTCASMCYATFILIEGNMRERDRLAFNIGAIFKNYVDSQEKI